MLRKAARGFTLIELMIVVAIIGILASIAIPNFLRYQLRSKSGEAAVNIGAIKTSEVAYFGSRDGYAKAALTPTTVPSGGRVTFAPTGSDGWENIGWKPEGTIYFAYGVVAEGAPAVSFTAYAMSNLDNDTANQCWSYRRADDNNGTNAQSDPSGCDDAGATSVFNQVVKSSADGVY